MPATVSRENFRTRGPQGYVVELPEAATQSFVAGDFVSVTTSGTIQLPVTAGNTVDSGEVGVGLVRALEPATGTTGNLVSCEVIPQNQQQLLIYVNGTAQIDSVQTAVGDLLTLRYITAAAPAGVTTIMWGVDANDSTNGIARLVEFDKGETIATSGNYHMVWCTLIDAARWAGF